MKNRLKWVDILLVGYLLYVLAAFIIPRILQQGRPPEIHAVARYDVSLLEEVWYDSSEDRPDSLYEALVKSDRIEAFGAGYAEMLGEKHPCTREVGWVMLKHGEVVAGLKTGRLCLDLNGMQGPNQSGQDIYRAVFQPHTNGQNLQRDFFWGRPDSNDSMMRLLELH